MESVDPINHELRAYFYYPCRRHEDDLLLVRNITLTTTRSNSTRCTTRLVLSCLVVIIISPQQTWEADSPSCPRIVNLCLSFLVIQIGRQCTGGVEALLVKRYSAFDWLHRRISQSNRNNSHLMKYFVVCFIRDSKGPGQSRDSEDSVVSHRK